MYVYMYVYICARVHALADAPTLVSANWTMGMCASGNWTMLRHACVYIYTLTPMS